MTNATLVLRKLAHMREHTTRARQRRPESVRELTEDLQLQDALALNVLVAIQEAIDVAFHVATDEGWGVPASAGESFDLLAQKSVLSAELAKELALAAGLRNRIAHGYAAVDVDRLWVELPAGLDALDAFSVAVAGHLSR